MLFRSPLDTPDFRQRRKELGYTVEELAEKSGVSRGTIKNIEARRCNPRSYNIEAIAKALDLDITYRDYYIHLHGEDENSSDKISEIDKNVEDKLSLFLINFYNIIILNFSI